MQTAPGPSVRETRVAAPGAGRSHATLLRAPGFYGWGVVASLVAAIASLWILPSVTYLNYDAWSWAVWGRELAHGTLATAGAASSIKPLPVFVDAGLSVLGSNAPWAWLVIARAGTVMAALVAFRLGTRLSSGRWVAGTFAAAGLVTSLEVAGYIFFGGYSDGIEICLGLCAVDLFLSRRRWATFVVLLVASLSRIEVSAFLVIYIAWSLRVHDRRALTVLSGTGAVFLVLFGWFGLDLISSGDAFRSAVQAQSGNPGRPIFQAHPFLAVLSEAVDDVLLPVTVAFGAEMVRGVVTWMRTGRARPTLLIGTAALCWVGGEGMMAQLHLATGNSFYLVTGLGLGTVVAGVFVGDLAALAWERRRRVGPVLVGVSLAGIALGLVTSVVPYSETASSWWGNVQGDYAGSVPVAHQDAQVAAAVKAAGGRQAVVACGRVVQASALANPVVAWALSIPLNQVSDHLESPGVTFLTDAPPVPAIRSGTWSIVISDC